MEKYNHNRSIPFATVDGKFGKVAQHGRTIQVELNSPKLHSGYVYAVLDAKYCLFGDHTYYEHYYNLHRLGTDKKYTMQALFEITNMALRLQKEAGDGGINPQGIKCRYGSVEGLMEHAVNAVRYFYANRSDEYQSGRISLVAATPRSQAYMNVTLFAGGNPGAYYRNAPSSAQTNLPAVAIDSPDRDELHNHLRALLRSWQPKGTSYSIVATMSYRTALESEARRVSRAFVLDQSISSREIMSERRRLINLTKELEEMYGGN